MKILSTLLMLCLAFAGFTQDVNITFTVNMANETTAPTGVYLAGGGNFGNPGDNPMFDDGTNGDAVAGDDVWTIVAVKPIGFSGNYTFTNGNCPDYSCKENIVGEPCADGPFSDRFTVPINSDTTIQACFSQCTTDGSCDAPSFGNVTFQVDMNNYTDPYSMVSVGGTWNGFDPNTSTVLTETPIGSGIYVGTVNLQDGSYSYKFIADAGIPGTEYYEDLIPGPCVISEGGFSNRALNVAGDATLPLVCLGSCNECTTTSPGNITLSVDMNSYEGAEVITDSSMYISGAFNGWCGDCNMMTANGDGTFTGTVNMPAGPNEYKFTINNWSDQEFFNGSEPCTTPPAEFVNRLVEVDGDSTEPLVCFQACVTCDLALDPGNITFTVDMNQYAGPEIVGDSSLYISGGFNGWCGDCNMMNSNGDGTYTVTVFMPAGLNEYKFQINQWADQEFFDGSESCTTPPAEFVNRAIEVDGDAITPEVCFASCEACVVEGDCSVFDTAPVDLTKSFDPVDGIQDRVQVKWFKASPEVRYSDEDAAACDIKFWAKRNLDPVTGSPVGPAITDPDTILIKDTKKFYPDGTTPREIFKWPVKFSATGANNAKRADPNVRYEWKVRCACEHGEGVESPWSAVKIFNTPDFDPATGIYTPPGGIINGDAAKLLGQSLEMGIYPNPSDGNSLTLVLNQDLSESLDIRVIAISGEMVFRQTGNVKGNQIQLDFGNALSSGMYFIQVESNGIVSNERFVVK